MGSSAPYLRLKPNFPQLLLKHLPPPAPGLLTTFSLPLSEGKSPAQRRSESRGRVQASPPLPGSPHSGAGRGLPLLQLHGRREGSHRLAAAREARDAPARRGGAPQTGGFLPPSLNHRIHLNAVINGEVSPSAE